MNKIVFVFCIFLVACNATPTPTLSAEEKALLTSVPATATAQAPCETHFSPYAHVSDGGWGVCWILHGVWRDAPGTWESPSSIFADEANRLIAKYGKEIIPKEVIIYLWVPAYNTGGPQCEGRVWDSAPDEDPEYVIPK